MDRSGWTYYLGRYLVLAVLLVQVAGFSRASAGELDLYLALQDYRWREFVQGSPWLEESGLLYGFGLLYSTDISERVTLRPGIEIFGGTVDYDGQTDSGSDARTDTNYFGVKAESDLGRRFGAGGDLVLEPFAGMGLRAWTRDIEDALLSDGTLGAGYPEDWFSLYGRLGLRGSGRLSGQQRVFAQAGVKAPLYNRMTAYKSEAGGQDFTFHPGKEPSFFAEAGIRAGRFTGSLFYEGMRFGQSESIITRKGIYELVDNYQPESKADIYGVKLGILF